MPCRMKWSFDFYKNFYIFAMFVVTDMKNDHKNVHTEINDHDLHNERMDHRPAVKKDSSEQLSAAVGLKYIYP